MEIKLTQIEMDTIDAIIKDAMVDLCVTAFRVQVEIATSDEPDKIDGYSVVAEIVIHYRNLHATITLYPCLIEDFRKDPCSIIPHLYHEVAHIVTNRLKSLIWPLLNLDIQYESVCQDAHEHTTEMLGRLALQHRQSYDASYKEKPNAESQKTS